MYCWLYIVFNVTFSTKGNRKKRQETQKINNENVRYKSNHIIKNFKDEWDSSIGDCPGGGEAHWWHVGPVCVRT